MSFLLNDVEDVVVHLINLSDPKGVNRKRLEKIKRQIEQNVMLGPRQRRYIEKCYTNAVDSIECRRMGISGECELPNIRRCEFVGKWEECPHHKKRKGDRFESSNDQFGD